MKLENRNLKPGTWNPEPGTRNLEPGTWNLEPGTWNLEPGTKPKHMNLKLEVCAGSLTSALNAQAGGAHRIELCDNLNEGGTTPSAGTVILAKKLLGIPVFVLIRPRAGDFTYSDVEFESMQEDILFCKRNGLDGIVTGILTGSGNVDIDRMRILVDLARPMQVTFHRAFDLTPDPIKALEEIISLGIERILTSGQAENALAGAKLIKQLNNRTNNNIIIMPGGGVTENNIHLLVNQTGAQEVHASLRSPVNSTMCIRNTTVSMGTNLSDDYCWMETDRHRVKKMYELMTKLYE